jgi:dTDP-4-amino-4,6-dideoxygalactose transaminase
LKNLNVWGDGGVIVTRSGELNDKLRLLRNHGLTDRDRAAVFGHNSRLDSLQAVIGNRLINQAESITERRIANARHLDEGFADLADFIRVPPRQSNVRHVYHIYIVRAKRRDELLKFLGEREIEAKIHYPVPVHLQPAAQYLGYQEGDFPTAESDSRTMITLPAHQHLEDEEIDYVTESVRDFYGKN